MEEGNRSLSLFQRVEMTVEASSGSCVVYGYFCCWAFFLFTFSFRPFLVAFKMCVWSLL